MKNYGVKIGLAIVALLVLVSGGTIQPARANFAFNDPAFNRQWDRLDLPVQNTPTPPRGYTWGPPVVGSGRASVESYDGKPRPVQYFEKARMEINPQVADPKNPWHVTTGLLVKEMVTGQRQEGDNSFTAVSPSTEAVAGDPKNPLSPTYASFKDQLAATAGQTGQPINRQLDRAGQVSPFQPPETRTLTSYDTITGHNVADVFEVYARQTGPIWNNSHIEDGEPLFYPNPLYFFGHPISEPYWTRTIVAGTEQAVLVQLFERRSLTYTPANTAANKVEMGNVGLHYFNWRYQPLKSNESCRQGMPEPRTPTAPAPFPQDFSQPAASYLSSGPIPEGGQGRVFPYITGVRYLYGQPAISQDGTLAILATQEQGLIALRLNDNVAQICEAWRYNPPGSTFYNTPLLYNGLAIVGDATGTLHAIRLSDGTAAWTRKDPHQLYGVSTPITDGTNLYFTGATDEIASENYGPISGHLYALRLSDGGLAWQSPNIFGAGSKVIFGFDGNLFFGGADKQIYGYTREGKPLAGWPSPTFGNVATRASGIETYSYANNRIYVGNGIVYALDRTGQIVDSFSQTNSSTNASPAIVGDTVYIGLETYGTKTNPEGQPIYNSEFEVKALNANNLKEVRFTFHTDFPPGSTSLTVVDGYIYFGAAERFFQVRADGSGFNRQMFRAGDTFGSIPVVNNGRVYVVGSDGNFCIRSQGAKKHQIIVK